MGAFESTPKPTPTPQPQQRRRRRRTRPAAQGGAVPNAPNARVGRVSRVPRGVLPPRVRVMAVPHYAVPDPNVAYVRVVYPNGACYITPVQLQRANVNGQVYYGPTVPPNALLQQLHNGVQCVVPYYYQPHYTPVNFQLPPSHAAVNFQQQPPQAQFVEPVNFQLPSRVDNVMMNDVQKREVVPSTKMAVPTEVQEHGGGVPCVTEPVDIAVFPREYGLEENRPAFRPVPKVESHHNYDVLDSEILLKYPTLRAQYLEIFQHNQSRINNNNPSGSLQNLEPLKFPYTPYTPNEQSDSRQHLEPSGSPYNQSDYVADSSSTPYPPMSYAPRPHVPYTPFNQSIYAPANSRELYYGIPDMETVFEIWRTMGTDPDCQGVIDIFLAFSPETEVDYFNQKVQELTASQSMLFNVEEWKIDLKRKEEEKRKSELEQLLEHVQLLEEIDTYEEDLSFEYDEDDIEFEE